MIGYIQLNPVAAGLVADPADDSRSGHRDLITGSTDSLIDAAPTLGIYGELGLRLSAELGTAKTQPPLYPFAVAPDVATASSRAVRIGV